MVSAKLNGTKTKKIVKIIENMFKTSKGASYKEPLPFRRYRKSKIIILHRFSNFFRINFVTLWQLLLL